MSVLIPLLTMTIVSVVSCVDMYVDKNEKYTEINKGYPVLSWESSKKSEIIQWDGRVSTVPKLYTTKIDKEDYYVVNDIADLAAVIAQGGEWLKKNYCLGKDIDLNHHEWTPLGKDEKSPFEGKFEGNGHVIKNLKITKSNGNSGFFGYIRTAKIQNLGIDSGEISGATDTVGIITGTMENSIIKNCFVRKGEIKVKENQTEKDVALGGISGKMINNSKIRTCYFRGTISEPINENQLTGSSSDSDIRYCYIVGKSENEILIQLVGTNEFNISEDISERKLKESASIIGKDGVGFRNDSALTETKSTQIGLFMIICVALFVGICNSIQEIVKERGILKREYMSNLRLGAYVISKMIVQGVICAVQSLIVTVMFYIAVSRRIYPTTGIVTFSAQMDFYITIVLVIFAADVTALFISSIVKSSVMANTFIPIILIVQIIYSGVLFELGKVGDVFASLMISKWGVAALSAISHLNESRPELLINNPQYEQSLGEELLKIKTINQSSLGNVIKIWGILILFIVVFAVAIRVALVRIKKDKR